MNEKHINIRQASNGFVVNFYENPGSLIGPGTDVTAVFATLDEALAYVKNILSGEKSAPLAEIPA